MNSITIKVYSLFLTSHGMILDDPFSFFDSSLEDLTDTEKTDESDDSFIDALLKA